MSTLQMSDREYHRVIVCNLGFRVANERYLRILYLLTSLGFGGAEKQTVALAECMAAKGHVVKLVVLKHTGEEWPINLPVFHLNLNKRVISVLRGLVLVRGFVLDFNADVIHSHTYPANIFGRILALNLLGRRPRPRLVNTIHNVYEGGWLRMLVYRLSSPFTDGVTAVSNAAAERFIGLGAVPPEKMVVLTNGIDLEAFSTDSDRRRLTRSIMQAGDCFVWLAVGRLAAAKDYPNLLNAFMLLRKLAPGTRLWIAGEGSVDDLDLPCSPELHSIFSEDRALEFLGLCKNVVEMLDAADGFVLSSAWEGMPLVVGEAMAMEKVVVATDVGGVRQMVGNAGVLVRPGDSQALAEAMGKVMRMTAFEQKSMGQSARARIKDNFSMEAKVSEWNDMYDGLVGRKQAQKLDA